MDLMYSIDAYNMTAEKAALHFAETYFDKPRKITPIVNNQFSFIDGNATYEIQYREGKRFVSFDVYEIWRLS